MSKTLRKRIDKLAAEQITTSVGREGLIRSERRRLVRYWCYRFGTEAEGGAEATGAPTGLRKYFEGQQKFRTYGGWREFAGRWDVGTHDPFEIVPRSKSVWKEWDEALVKSVPILPSHVEG